MAAALLVAVVGEADLDGAGRDQLEVELVEGGGVRAAAEVEHSARLSARGQRHADHRADALGGDAVGALEALVLLRVRAVQRLVIGKGLLVDRAADHWAHVRRRGAHRARHQLAGGRVAAEDQRALGGHGLHQAVEDAGLLVGGFIGIRDQASDLVEDAQTLDVLRGGLVLDRFGDIRKLVDAELEGVGKHVGIIIVGDAVRAVVVGHRGAGLEDHLGGADLDHVADAQQLLVAEALVVDVGAVLGVEVAHEVHAADGEDLAVEARGAAVEDLHPRLGVAADGQGLLPDGLLAPAVGAVHDADLAHRPLGQQGNSGRSRGHRKRARSDRWARGPKRRVQAMQLLPALSARRRRARRAPVGRARDPQATPASAPPARAAPTRRVRLAPGAVSVRAAASASGLPRAARPPPRSDAPRAPRPRPAAAAARRARLAKASAATRT